MNIPYIERINKNDVDKVYTEGYFRSTLDGDLATTSATTTAVYGAKFDDGSMRQDTLSNASTTWVVTDKNGTQYTYGSTTNVLIATSTSVFRWMLTEVRDANNTAAEGYTERGWALKQLETLQSVAQSPSTTILFTPSGLMEALSGLGKLPGVHKPNGVSIQA